MPFLVFFKNQNEGFHLTICTWALRYSTLVGYLLKYSNRYRQAEQKEEKARPRPRPSEKNPRPGASETGARSAYGLGAHELLNMFGLEPTLGSQPGAMPSAPGVQAPNGGEGAPDPGRQLATCAFVFSTVVLY